MIHLMAHANTFKPLCRDPEATLLTPCVEEVTCRKCLAALERNKPRSLESLMTFGPFASFVFQKTKCVACGKLMPYPGPNKCTCGSSVLTLVEVEEAKPESKTAEANNPFYPRK